MNFAKYTLNGMIATEIKVMLISLNDCFVESAVIQLSAANNSVLSRRKQTNFDFTTWANADLIEN